MKQERLIHIDILRILACFSVLVLHSAAQYWYGLPVTDKNWLIINSYDAVARFGVPVFVMISGALFLDTNRQIDTKKLYLHNILRMVFIYFVWSAVYGLFDCRVYDWSALKPADFLLEIYTGRYHLWYLPMTVGLYMLIPVWKKWLEHADEKDVQYFLLLFLVFKIIRNTVMVLKPMEWLKFLWGAFEFGDMLDYPGYFIFGYYIAHYNIAARWRRWIYVAGILGAGANVILGNYKALNTGLPNGEIYDSFSMFTFLTVTALFVFGVEKVSKWKVPLRIRAVIKEISMATLGIYLIHLLWMEILQSQGIDSMMVTPIIGVPLCALICFVLSFFCAAILRRIPVIGKFIC